ncbi:binding-protein-dependent transport systems inner membrane component [Ignisphaera aggregans DSM 17230]|uniref:Binding-protein-dependent transport systems inner membrane component n=1 Tax=Ignisphaera aggregans (strain DSM 17230 / JCM 13409 / AQ1.S1) TaxID=583356 RepID=E0SNH8_IGNAA|nr:binding-protein-dependent transport systems inner membrane component [Ignisphaera aggregans DSM 17230]
MSIIIKNIGNIVREMARAYRASVIGLAILITLVCISIYTVIVYPYDYVVKIWNSQEVWQDNPRNALPSWINIFLPKKLPETIVINSSVNSNSVMKTKSFVSELGAYKIVIDFRIPYNYDDFPTGVRLSIIPRYTSFYPLASITWIKPDGTSYYIQQVKIRREFIYDISSDESLLRNVVESIEERVGNSIGYPITLNEALFAQEDHTILSKDTIRVLKGDYRVVVEAIVFDENDDIDAKLVIYGKVYGLAGTDHLRRDLLIPILWGTPIALAFGLTASLCIVLFQMIYAAISAWYGGLVDTVIQRLTEIMMVLPFLPIVMMISYIYRITIWTLLAIIIALSMLGSGVKNYRAMFLQLKESPYIEAARAYGAGNLRIIFMYLIPRVLPTVLPSIIYSVPDFVFLEAVLALLGVGDPLAPTWGKVLEDALNNGALYKGYYYWVLEPSALLILTSLGFALIGFALDRIFNPRLREM